MDPEREKCLEKQCSQRNGDGHRRTEPVDLYLILRCVGYRHASAVYPPTSQFPMWQVGKAQKLPLASPLPVTPSWPQELATVRSLASPVSQLLAGLHPPRACPGPKADAGSEYRPHALNWSRPRMAPGPLFS